jgi:hypothetical protein
MPKLRMRGAYGIGVVLFVAALPFKTGGCGNTACMTVTATDLAQANGVCPSPDVASQRISGQACTTVTITGNGELDGALCCYPVQESTGGSCDFVAGETGTGTGVVFPGGGGAGPPVGEVVASASAGTGCVGPCCGAGGSGCGGAISAGCSTCGAVLASGAATNVLCNPALPALAELQGCACASGSACQAACSVSLCLSNGSITPPDPGCQQCLLSSATSGCAAAVANCQMN